MLFEWTNLREWICCDQLEGMKLSIVSEKWAPVYVQPPSSTKRVSFVSSMYVIIHICVCMLLYIYVCVCIYIYTHTHILWKWKSLSRVQFFATPWFHLPGASPLPLDIGYLFLVASNIFLSMVIQQSVVILQFSQEKMRAHPSTLPFWSQTSQTFPLGRMNSLTGPRDHFSALLAIHSISQ